MAFLSSLHERVRTQRNVDSYVVLLRMINDMDA